MQQNQYLSLLSMGMVSICPAACLDRPLPEHAYWANCITLVNRSEMKMEKLEKQFVESLNKIRFKKKWNFRKL